MVPTLIRRPAPSIILLAALVLAACQTAPASSSPSGSATFSASAAASSQEASASAAVGTCLTPEVVAAIGELSGGNMETDPSRAEVADALEGLELTGAAADARDAVVMRLRENPPQESFVRTALLELRAQVALPEC